MQLDGKQRFKGSEDLPQHIKSFNMSRNGFG